MSDEIQILIDSLKSGQFEDPAETIALLAAALRASQIEVSFLATLLRAPQVPICLAALEACRGRSEPALIAEFISLSKNADRTVRSKVAECLQPDGGKQSQTALKALFRDVEAAVRLAAVKQTSGSRDFLELHKRALSKEGDPSVRLAAASALAALKEPEIVDVVFQALVVDTDKKVRYACAQIIEDFLKTAKEETLTHLPSKLSTEKKAEDYFQEQEAERFPLLFRWVQEKTQANVDPSLLVRFGTDLTELAHKGSLQKAFYFDEACENLERLIRRKPARSLALVGAAGVGKTALVHELVQRLMKPEKESWRVLRVSPTEFLAGTKWLGEWQSKLSDLVQTIKAPGRVLLYIPKLNELNGTGTTSRSESNVATALAPYLEDGSVVLLGECTPEEFEEGIGRDPSLVRLLDKVLILESSVPETRRILRALRDDAKSSLTDELFERLLELSEQFLNHVQRPGNSVGLFRDLVQREKEAGRLINFQDMLATLSSSTGVPVGLLDDAVPLDEREVRDFFENRIVGQKEAVDAVTDLVTLIKAGLTDPQKPLGIFLFVGPTGVGKTELAKALAEYIFGDSARLRRFDMSEYADAYGFQRLIGGRGENGKLTDSVREQPFSVILLDEIEKSHINVFDLCLQLFDAGRLTDGNGRTVDFRRSIIILTSNIGASVHTTPLGFGAASREAAPELDKDRTFRELSRFFRPEFLNRIDRIVQFLPLTLQVAEKIARREIDAVLQRSGIRRRELIVDIDPTVISLLVQEGYSPHFGARPLKRTVERLLLQPLARTLASGSLVGKTILRVTERNGRVEAVRTAVPTSLETLPPSVFPLETRCRSLRDTYDRLEDLVRPLTDRKSELLDTTHRPEFFYDADLRAASLGEIHNLEQFLAFYERVGRNLREVERHLDRLKAKEGDESSFREELDALGSEIRHLRFVSQAQDSRDLGDALLVLTLLDRGGEDLHSVEKLAGMYLALAARHRLSPEVLGEFYDGSQNRAYLQISGLGAFGLLKSESGLHRVGRRYKENAPRSGRELLHEDRELLRVDLYPIGSPSDQFAKSTKTNSLALKPAKKRLLTCSVSISLFHESSVRSLEFWTSGTKAEAIQTGLSILFAQVERGDLEGEGSIVRQYDLGLAAKIKDHRTGRSTERVDKIFKGGLGILLGYDDE